MTLRTDRALQMLLASLFLWMFGIGLYEQLIPIYARQLGASPVELGSLFTIRHLALAGGFFISLVVADRWSKRKVIVASWLIATPVPLLLAAAPTYGWLVPGLLLYEITVFGSPAINAFVARRVPPSELASTFGAMGTITSLGFLVSPTVGGMLADRLGIRATLVIAAAFYVVSTILIFRVRWGDVDTAAPRAALGSSSVQLQALKPLLWIYSIMTLVILITVPFATPFLREVRGLSLSEIGFLSSMVALGAVLLTPVAGRLGDRIGLLPAMAGGLIVFAAGIFFTVYGPAVLLPLAAVIRCRSPLQTIGNALIGAQVPPAMLGRAFSLAGILSSVLGAAGAFAGGYAYRLDPALPLLISVGMGIVLAGILYLQRSMWSHVGASDAARVREA